MTWLIDTLTMTGLLIAAILILRRPVSRLFGPRFAYALWLLPLLRLALPPISLPAAWAPRQEAMPSADTVVILTGDHIVEAAPVWTWTDALAGLWLAGAVTLIVWRVVTYSRMRRSLLANARPVGETGRIRLVESPAVTAPVAFGVRDKVIALPPGFMAWHDRQARDLALAHEFEHHAGHDLLINIAAQPLLALHWFNPLAWAGWRAMRRDQEAACDARVLAGRGEAVRANYARLIASLAGGPRLALAAPMACPVLGEKSIIHRLRSLTMPEPTASRRRLGKAFVAATFLALPLTATFGYAAPDAPSAPEAPSAPGAPDAPASPDAPKATKRIVIIHQKDGATDPAKLKTRTVTRNGKTVTITTDEDISDADLDARLAAIDSAAEQMVIVGPETPEPPADPAKPQNIERRIVISTARGEPVQAIAIAGEAAGCADVNGPVAVESTSSETGKRRVMKIRVCAREHAMASAAEGIRKARDRIAGDASMPSDVKAQVVKELDEEIARMAKGS